MKWELLLTEILSSWTSLIHSMGGASVEFSEENSDGWGFCLISYQRLCWMVSALEKLEQIHQADVDLC